MIAMKKDDQEILKEVQKNSSMAINAIKLNMTMRCSKSFPSKNSGIL